LVKDSEGTLVGEVESRLEDLFGGGDEVPGAGGNEGESGEFFVREGVGVYAGDEKGDFPSGEPDDSPEFIEDADFLDDSKTLRYLESVVLSIERMSDHMYWNGSAWQALEVWLTATGTETGGEPLSPEP